MRNHYWLSTLTLILGFGFGGAVTAFADDKEACQTSHDEYACERLQKSTTDAAAVEEANRLRLETAIFNCSINYDQGGRMADPCGRVATLTSGKPVDPVALEALDAVSISCFEGKDEEACARLQGLYSSTGSAKQLEAVNYARLAAAEHACRTGNLKKPGYEYPCYRYYQITGVDLMGKGFASGKKPPGV